jgi:hypothetical protein
MNNSLTRINFRQALVEVLLIAFGVIAALGVQSWWEGEQDRKAELGYLNDLQNDFLVSSDNFQQNIDSISEVFGHVDAIFVMIRDPELREFPETFSQTLGRAYFVYDTSPITATYEGMINAGDLSLIRNESLKKVMAQFMTELEHLKFYEEMVINSYWEVQAPFINRHLVTTEFGWFGPGTDTEPEVTEIVGSEHDSPFEINDEAIRSQEFWNLMFSWKSVYSDLLTRIIIARKLCHEILAMLDEEIARHSED